jgi:hypothetical protein
VWDEHRGRTLPEVLLPSATDFAALDSLGEQLVVSKWRPNTRVSYDRWFGVWAAFTKVNACSLLPAEELWFGRFIILLGCYYAQSTVQIAVAAVVAIHRLNGLESPMASIRVKDLLASLKANGRIGASCQKLIVDSSFVAKMCEVFLSNFPDWDASLFHPYELNPEMADGLAGFKGMSVACMRGVAVVLIGLAVGLRAGEVGNLTVCCWQHRLLGSIYVHVKEAKNGNIREEAGGYLFREEGSFSQNYSAVAFFEEFWLAFLEKMRLFVHPKCTHGIYPTLRCKWCPPLFPSFPREFRSVPVSAPWWQRVKAVSGSEVSSVVKQWAAQIGLDPRSYSAISFRRGSVSIAAAEKVARNIRQKQCRWKSKSMQDVYTEVSVAEQLEYGKALSRRVQKSKKNHGKKVDFKVASGKRKKK